MTPAEYINQRVDHQIEWYSRKSQDAQQYFRRLRGAEIISAAIIPFLAGFTTTHIVVPAEVGCLRVVVVVLAAFQSLGQHHERWIEYRTTCESLKHEKYLYLTTSEPYDSEDPFPLFVERVESLISKENSAWAQHTRTAVKKSKVEADTS